MKLFIVLLFSIQILWAQNQPQGRYYFVCAKSGESSSQVYGHSQIDAHTENLNILAYLLGDRPVAKLPNLLVAKTEFTEKTSGLTGKYQPFAFTNGVSAEQFNLPAGPNLRNFIDNYFGTGVSADLSLPFYTDSTVLHPRREWIDACDFHGGIDFVKTGVELFEVCAASDGTVVQVGQNGTMVRISHVKNNKEFLTQYTHLDPATVVVAVGDTVFRGQKLGRIAKWEDTSAPDHLHFMLWFKGPAGVIDGINIPSNFYVVDPFSVFDYHRNIMSTTDYNYTPYVELPPAEHLRKIIKGSNHTIHWRSNPLINSFPEMYGSIENWTANSFSGENGTFFADVTGDGKADAISVNQTSKVYVRRSNGSTFQGIEEWTDIPYFGNKGTFFADVTGDGKADAIAVNQDLTVVVRRSNGSRFLPNEEWTEIPFFGDNGSFFADVTGDGKADAISISSKGKIIVRRSTGRAFSANEEWTDIPFYGNKGTFFADVTGDGKVDAIAVNQNLGIVIRRSSPNGNGFNRNEEWTEKPFFGTKYTFFADVDGNGLADAIAVSESENKVNVRFSTGNGFSQTERAIVSSFTSDKGLFFADLNGDKTCEAIAVKNSNIRVRSFKYKFR